jgi:Zn-finger nucleic acid-binding protein
METFKAMARDKGAPVELDRCLTCKRVWFDVPEVERATGRPYLSRLEGTASPRKCPACTGAMNDVLIGGEITVEQCTQCRGALVDPSQLKALSGGPLVEHVPPMTKKKQQSGVSVDLDLGDVLNDLLHSLFG